MSAAVIHERTRTRERLEMHAETNSEKERRGLGCRRRDLNFANLISSGSRNRRRKLTFVCSPEMWGHQQHLE